MDEDPAGCQRCIGSQEKRSNQLKYLEQKKKKKTRSPKTTAKADKNVY